MASIIAVGDIHGCLNELNNLIGKMPIKSSLLVFLGDYIDRGPNSYGVIEYIKYLENTNRKYRTVFLRGNHEDMLLKAIDGEGPVDWHHIWINNGGVQTLQSYGVSNIFELRDKYPSHIKFLRNTKIEHETEKHIFVHAGFSWSEPFFDARLWSRVVPTRKITDKNIICGHNPQKEPLINDACICIDTGACFPPGQSSGGYLTGVKIREDEEPSRYTFYKSG